MTMNKICVYGVYRKGMIGFDFLLKTFGSNSVLYKRTVDLPFYVMYDCIFHAAIEFTGKRKDNIVVDLLLVDDAVYNYLKSVKRTNYFEHLVNIDYQFYSLFIEWPVPEDEKYKEVVYGDWVKLNKKNETWQQY